MSNSILTQKFNIQLTAKGNEVLEIVDLRGSQYWAVPGQRSLRFWKPQGCHHGAECGRCHLCPATEINVGFHLVGFESHTPDILKIGFKISIDSPRHDTHK